MEKVSSSITLFEQGHLVMNSGNNFDLKQSLSNIGAQIGVMENTTNRSLPQLSEKPVSQLDDHVVLKYPKQKNFRPRSPIAEYIRKGEWSMGSKEAVLEAIFPNKLEREQMVSKFHTEDLTKLLAYVDRKFLQENAPDKQQLEEVRGRINHALDRLDRLRKVIKTGLQEELAHDQETIKRGNALLPKGFNGWKTAELEVVGPAFLSASGITDSTKAMVLAKNLINWLDHTTTQTFGTEGIQNGCFEWLKKLMPNVMAHGGNSYLKGEIDELPIRAEPEGEELSQTVIASSTSALTIDRFMTDHRETLQRLENNNIVLSDLRKSKSELIHQRDSSDAEIKDLEIQVLKLQAQSSHTNQQLVNLEHDEARLLRENHDLSKILECHTKVLKAMNDAMEQET